MNTGERPVDLRSDTVTQPTAGMRQAMMAAPLGDDVLGDDPTVIALQERMAAHLGKEAACYVPSGTMANQLAIRALCGAGDEIIAHADSHIIHYETGAPAALSGCMVRAVCGPKGQFRGADVLSAIRPDNIHAPASRLLSVENTQNRGGGSVWPMELLRDVTSAARSAGLLCHLDGARLWNASIASGVPMREYAAIFDTVSCCFSKGLGAPVGSIIAGDKATIRKVVRYRKMFGGAMRQSGVLAAACAYAMQNHVERLRDDHAHARRLADAIRECPGLSLSPEQRESGVETNIVYFDLNDGIGMDGQGMCAALEAQGVRMLPTAARRVRAVTHLDVDSAGIDRAIRAIRSVVRA